VRWPAVLASLVCLAGATVTGDELATGGNERFERATLPRYVHVYTIFSMEDRTASVLAFGAGTRVGDAYDVVDDRGYVGRLMVDRVELHSCGDAHYYDVQTRFVAKRPGRAPDANLALALAPARRPPLRARVIAAADVPDAPEGKEGLQAVDIDGDGRADLLHYQFHSCGPRAVSDDTSACFETWERTPSGWRRIERAEFPVCERG
jgi:hypothetical protein